MAAVCSHDPTFFFEGLLQTTIADECYEAVDLGPTDRLSPDQLELEYRQFFGSTSPLTSPSTSPSSSRSPSRTASPHPINPKSLPPRLPEPSAPSSPTLESPNLPRKVQNSDRKRNKKRLHEHRAKKRYGSREAARSRPLEVSQDDIDKCVGPAKPTLTTFDSKRFPTASTGYVALPDHSERGKIYKLKELVQVLGFKIELWDGKCSRPITDASGRIIAVLAGHPNDLGWDVVHRGAAEAIRISRRKCRFPKKTLRHRRGNFPALNWGISHGGGQKQPGNLCHNVQNTKALSELLTNKYISRIAGYANKAFAMWAPNLYTYYETYFNSLLSNDPTLRRNWPNNVWASFAVNFGPKTICCPHRDFANLPFGWCGITALGDFDPTKGGHLILWNLKLAVEFPPGSTILVPSAAIAHSNVPIGQRETRYSFTQFSAGGLFRWVEQGFQCTNAYKAKLTPDDVEEDLRRQDERCKLGLSLFSTMKSLPVDLAVRKRLVKK